MLYVGLHESQILSWKTDCLFPFVFAVNLPEKIQTLFSCLMHVFLCEERSGKQRLEHPKTLKHASIIFKMIIAHLPKEYSCI